MTQTTDPDSLLSATHETTAVDFKATLDVDNKGQWLEVLKDLVALANSGGGLVLIGLDDAGLPTGFDATRVLEYDISRIGDKLRKYTGVHFGGIALRSVPRDQAQLAGIQVSASAVPLVFTADGQYQNEHNQEKFAFRQGSVYFRHGAKSEPGTSEDLRLFLEREIDRVKTSWLGSIRQVVEAPIGSTVTILAPAAGAIARPNSVRLVAIDSAEPCKILNPDDTHPFRQTDVMSEVNKRLAGKFSINQSTVQDVRKAHQSDSRSMFYWKGNHSASQFSQAFVDWIVESYENDPQFFQKAHVAHRSIVIARNDARRKRIPTRSTSPEPSHFAQ